MGIIEPYSVSELHYDGVGSHFVVDTTLKYTFWTWQMVDGVVRKVAIMKAATPFDLQRIEMNVQASVHAFHEYLGRERIAPH